jgi:hypothetical protein
MKIQSIQVCVDEVVRERLKDAARAERRPLASPIRNILTDAVQERVSPKQGVDAVRP